MAITKTITNPFSGRTNYELYLTVTETSTNPAGNTSVVSWTLGARVRSGYTNGGTWNGIRDSNWSVTVDGTTTSNTWLYDFRSTNDITIATGSKTVTHAADGSKTMSFSASADGGSGNLGSASMSSTVALTNFTNLPGKPNPPTVTRTAPSTTVNVTSAVPTSAVTISQYQIRYSTDSTYATGTTTLTLTTTTGSFTGVRGTTYYVSTRAYSTEGWGAWSNNSSIYVPNIPAAPASAPTLSRSATGTGLTVTSGTATSDATVTTYLARYRAVGDASWTTVDLGADRVSDSPIGVVAATAYEVQTAAVSAENPANNASSTFNWSASATSAAVVITPPSITSLTVSEAATVTNLSTIGAYVKGFSQLNIAMVGATPSTGATITSYVITVAGQTINAVSGTTSVLTQSGNLTVTATITDSSGFTATRTQAITVLDYSVPVISSATYNRATSGGTISDTGNHLRVDLTATVSSLLVSAAEKNTLTVEVWSRVRGGTTFTKNTLVSPASFTGVTFNSYVLASGFSTGSSYDVQVRLIDKFNTVTSTNVIATATILFDLGDTGAGVGKYLEKSDASIDAAGKLYQGGGQVVNGTVIAATLTDLNAWPTTHLVAGVTRGRVGNTDYIWGGSSWAVTARGATVGDNPPSSPSNGDLWLDSSDGTAYVFYNDGSSSAWVQQKAPSASVVTSVVNGGTGAASLTSGAYLKGNGTSAVTAQTGIPAGDITSGTLALAQGGTGVTTGAGLVNVIPAGVSVGGGTATIDSNTGLVTFTNATTNISLNSCFSAAFTYYRVIWTFTQSGSFTRNDFRLRSGTTDRTGALYDWQQMINDTSGPRRAGQTAQTYYGTGSGSVFGSNVELIMDIHTPAQSSTQTRIVHKYSSWTPGSIPATSDGYGGYSTASADTGCSLLINAGATATGTVQVFAYRS